MNLLKIFCLCSSEGRLRILESEVKLFSAKENVVLDVRGGWQRLRMLMYSSAALTSFLWKGSIFTRQLVKRMKAVMFTAKRLLEVHCNKVT